MKRFVQRSPRKPGWDLARFWLPAITLLGAGHASADDIEWSNINGGLFSVGSNWIGGVVPGAGDRARFGRTRDPNQQADYTVTFNSSPINLGMVVEVDRVTFDLNGNAYSLTDSLSAMTVGTSANVAGRLTITEGILATSPDARVSVGGSPGATGFLTLSTGAQLFGPTVHVGFGGPGTLIVQNGADIVGGPMLVGSLESVGATGTATVTGAGSAVVVEDLSVGGRGAGTLNITAGGQVESTAGILGRNSGAIGTVNVDGANSRWTSSGFVGVGFEGQGALNITSGARVECPVVQVGLVNSGTVAVSGNSELIVQDSLDLGFEGQGTLNITDGARVECLAAQVGLDNSGVVFVSGNAELIVQDFLDLGFEGQGTLNISGGGLVQSSSATVGLIDAGSATVEGVGSRWICSTDMTVCNGEGTGALDITGGAEVLSVDGFIARFSGSGSVGVAGAGSAWTMTGDLSVGGDIGNGFDGGIGELFIQADGSVTADAVFIFPDGSVTLDGGTLDVSRMGLAFASGGEFEFLAGILHAGQIGFRVVNQGGTLAPPGFTTFVKDYTQQSGTMEIEIGGTTPGIEFDQVVVLGAASLGGTLDVRLIDGFEPDPVQTFTILDVSGNDTEGAFTNVASGQRLTTSDGHGSFAVHYGPGSQFDPTTIVLSDFRVCVADFNGDGTVDTRDVIAFLYDWSSRRDSADCDTNGTIDTRDVICFLSAWSAGC